MIDYIVKDIMEVAGYLPMGILCGLVAVVMYVICIRTIGSTWCADTLPEADAPEKTGNKPAKESLRGRHIWKICVWFMLTVYMVVMFITVFLSREPGSRKGVDMTLFGTWGQTPQEHAFVIENILLFVPFGILYPSAVSGVWRHLTVPAGCMISVIIETVQLMTERGYCQLDDVVMNTVGALVGYVIWLLVRGVKGSGRRKA